MRVNFRGLNYREALIFRGTQRWAEFSPFLEYSDQESAAWLESAISFANDPLPHLFRNEIPINATLPAVTPEEGEPILLGFGHFDSVKVKVAEKGQGLAADLARIREVARLYPNAKIRLDANGGYTIDQAIEIAEAIKDFKIEYLEQPVATVAELAELRSRLREAGSQILIAADESIRKSSDPLEVAKAAAADIAVLKVQPLGGIAKALSVASESGLEAVISSALETSIGISQGLYLAAALPSLNHDCGLGTLNLLDGDVCSRPLLPIAGKLAVTEVTPDPALIQKYAASPDRTAWWLARLTRCYELLES